jgi:hypothetical protein
MMMIKHNSDNGLVTDITEVLFTSIIKAMGQQAPLKCWSISIRLRSTTSHKKVIFIVTNFYIVEHVVSRIFPPSTASHSPEVMKDFLLKPSSPKLKIHFLL